MMTHYFNNRSTKRNGESTRRHRIVLFLILCQIVKLASCFMTVSPSSRIFANSKQRRTILNVPPKSSFGIFEKNERCRSPLEQQQQQHQKHALFALRPGSNNDGVEVGIQIAQLLLSDNDRGEYARVKQQLQKKFPLLPESVIDTMIEITANGFKTITPDKLQLALQPGKMQNEIRPELTKALVDIALQQPYVKNIPLLQQKEKQQLLEYLVDNIFIQIFQKQSNIEWILSTPEVRLETLENEMQQIHTEMGWKRLLWYRLRSRFHRRKMLLWSTTMVLGITIIIKTNNSIVLPFNPTAFLATLQPAVVGGMKWLKTSLSFISTVIMTLWDIGYQKGIQPITTVIANKFTLG